MKYKINFLSEDFKIIEMVNTIDFNPISSVEFIQSHNLIHILSQYTSENSNELASYLKIYIEDNLLATVGKDDLVILLDLKTITKYPELVQNLIDYYGEDLTKSALFLNTDKELSFNFNSITTDLDLNFSIQPFETSNVALYSADTYLKSDTSLTLFQNNIKSEIPLSAVKSFQSLLSDTSNSNSDNIAFMYIFQED